MAQQVTQVDSNRNPWRLTVTRSWGQGKYKKSRDDIQYFQRDTKYKSYVRWEVRLRDVSNISLLTVDRTDKYSLKPNDSFQTVLKITGIQELNMGSVCSLTPSVSYNPKSYLGTITRNSTYVRVYIYEKLTGFSGSTLYQSAADQYNIFMSELTEVWRQEMVDELVVNKIIKQKQLTGDQELNRNEMFEIMKVLFKRCKSNKVWGDFDKAFKESFGEMESNAVKRNNTNNVNSSSQSSMYRNNRNVNRFGTNNNVQSFSQPTPFGGGQSGIQTRSGFTLKPVFGGATAGSTFGGNQSNNPFAGFVNKQTGNSASSQQGSSFKWHNAK